MVIFVFDDLFFVGLKDIFILDGLFLVFVVVVLGLFFFLGFFSVNGNGIFEFLLLEEKFLFILFFVLIF